MNFWRLGGWVAGIGAFLMAGSLSADAQVFVYRLKLEEQSGKKLNFDFYERGYFIAPASESGTGTFIFTANDGDGLRFYTVARDAARYFMVRKRSEQKAVIFTQSQNGSANSVYMAVGDTDSTFNFGGEIGRVRYAEKLSGHVLAADDDSDPVYDDGSSSTVGFAGMSTMTLTLDEARTGDASRNEKSAAEVTSDLIRFLESNGFEGEGGSSSVEGDIVGTNEDGTPIFAAEPVGESDSGSGVGSESGSGGTAETGTGESASESFTEPEIFIPGVGFGGAGEVSDF